MEGTIIVNKINARLLPGVNSADVGDLYLNDKVYGEVINGWIKFERVYRANGVIDDGTKGYAAIHNPTNLTDMYMNLENKLEPDSNPFPDPAPAVKPLTISIGGEDYETVTIELKPK